MSPVEWGKYLSVHPRKKQKVTQNNRSTMGRIHQLCAILPQLAKFLSNFDWKRFQSAYPSVFAGMSPPLGTVLDVTRTKWECDDETRLYSTVLVRVLPGRYLDAGFKFDQLLCCHNSMDTLLIHAPRDEILKWILYQQDTYMRAKHISAKHLRLTLKLGRKDSQVEPATLNSLSMILLALASILPDLQSLTLDLQSASLVKTDYKLQKALCDSVSSVHMHDPYARDGDGHTWCRTLREFGGMSGFQTRPEQLKHVAFSVTYEDEPPFLHGLLECIGLESLWVQVSTRCPVFIVSTVAKISHNNPHLDSVCVCLSSGINVSDTLTPNGYTINPTSGQHPPNQTRLVLICPDMTYVQVEKMAFYLGFTSVTHYEDMRAYNQKRDSQGQSTSTADWNAWGTF